MHTTFSREYILLQRLSLDLEIIENREHSNARVLASDMVVTMPTTLYKELCELSVAQLKYKLKLIPQVT